MKGKQKTLKLSLRKKPHRQLTHSIQKTKLFKNQWPFRKSTFFIKSEGFGKLDLKKIEVCRVILRRAISTEKTRKSSLTKILINSPLNRVFTKKSSNQRMGKGKGSVKGRFSTVFPGKILFEMKVGKKPELKKAVKWLSDRLSFRVSFFFKTKKKSWVS